MTNRNYSKAMTKMQENLHTSLWDVTLLNPPHSAFPYIHPTHKHAILFIGMLVLVSMS
jgi:hypothetical protein